MDKLHLDPEVFVDQFKKLDQIYAAIDRAYSDVASQYGFHCSGCEDNCCLTRFYHHTFLEYFYLLKGYRGLERPHQIDIREKAETVCSALRETDSNTNGSSIRLMCPLNFDGLCCLYHHRPMICRMHGLPHELRRPDGRIIQGPGCAYLERHYGKKATASFDRTPFYHAMVGLEKELRLKIRADTKIKMTVAEMILAF